MLFFTGTKFIIWYIYIYVWRAYKLYKESKNQKRASLVTKVAQHQSCILKPCLDTLKHPLPSNIFQLKTASWTTVNAISMRFLNHIYILGMDFGRRTLQTWTLLALWFREEHRLFSWELHAYNFNLGNKLNSLVFQGCLKRLQSFQNFFLHSFYTEIKKISLHSSSY